MKTSLHPSQQMLRWRLPRTTLSSVVTSRVWPQRGQLSLSKCLEKRTGFLLRYVTFIMPG